MSVHEPVKGYILISSDIESEYKRIADDLRPNRVVGFIEDEFKIEHAKAVIAEAYISEEKTKYLILGANSFNTISQNSLLKLLEEPPRNIELIIISTSKSNLLATVRSRMPVIKGERKKEPLQIDINLSRISYKEIFEFLKANARVKKSDAKALIEAIYHKAAVVEKLILTSVQLQNFDKAYRLLELNSRPQSVLAMILMSFVGEKNAN